MRQWRRYEVVKIIKKILIIFIIFISGSLLYLSSENKIIMHILSLVFLASVAFAITKGDIMHPYAWFPAIFCLYSISYPVLFLLGYKEHLGYTKQLMILQWLALSSYLVVVSPVANTESLPESDSNIDFSVFIFLLALICAVVSIYFKVYGFSGKKEIYASGNLLILIAMRLPIYLAIFHLYAMTCRLCQRKGRYSYSSSWVAFAGVTLLAMFSGERDFMFRFVVITFFVLYDFKKIKGFKIIFILSILLLLLPVSAVFKYFALRNEVSIGLSDVNLRSLIVTFLASEFYAASHNIQTILSSSWDYSSFWGGSAIFIDFFRPFWPIKFSLARWFDELFYLNSSTGYGFTLVGQGYVAWGLWGVILVFGIVGIIIRILYNNHKKNIYFFMAYIYIIPLSMYSIRADLANIFSPFFRHFIVAIAVIVAIKLIRKNKGLD